LHFGLCLEGEDKEFKGRGWEGETGITHDLYS
jgi:hypothetical protein